MHNNINILLVGDDALVGELNEIGYSQIKAVVDSKTAIREFVDKHKNQSYDLTFITDLSDGSEEELLKSIIEIEPDHYVVMLTENLTPEKVLSSIRAGANGLLSKPFTANKLRMELEKFAFLRDKKSAFS